MSTVSLHNQHSISFINSFIKPLTLPISLLSSTLGWHCNHDHIPSKGLKTLNNSAAAAVELSSSTNHNHNGSHHQ